MSIVSEHEKGVTCSLLFPLVILNIYYCMKFIFTCCIYAFLFCIYSCTASSKINRSKDPGVTNNVALPNPKAFQNTIEGLQTNLYYLKNRNNMQAAITNYGARLVSLLVPDKNSRLVDVVLGYDSLRHYQMPGQSSFSATIGRFANRIGGAKFTLDGVEYKMNTSNGGITLHGGRTGFHTRVWKADQPNDSMLILTYQSKDGEEGFPGNLTTVVTYTVTDKNELRIDYAAITDKTTVINLTNHSYFNLNGEGSGSIQDHVLTLNANQVTETDARLIPTGKFLNVAGTSLDFRQPKPISQHINDTADAYIKLGRGYDHNFVLNKELDSIALAATVLAPKTGIIMQVQTTEPGVQFYTGNFISKNVRGKGNKTYDQRHGFCLETQHFPDSPNKPNFPTTVLMPGQNFRSTTIHRFSVQK